MTVSLAVPRMGDERLTAGYPVTTDCNRRPAGMNNAGYFNPLRIRMNPVKSCSFWQLNRVKK